MITKKITSAASAQTALWLGVKASSEKEAQPLSSVYDRHCSSNEVEVREKCVGKMGSRHSMLKAFIVLRCH